MAVRLTCTDNASGHDGLRWRMGEDSENVDIVVGETAPGFGELIVNDPITPEACFSVVAFAGEEESEAAEVCADTGPEDYNLAQIGDEIGGGIYAGIYAIGGVDYHIVAGKADAETSGLEWKTSQTSTPGTDDADDGLANTIAMDADGISDHPAAAYCMSYTGGGHDDWYMPAINEWSFLYTNLGAHPDFADNASSGELSWSSTQYTSQRAWVIRFSDGVFTTNIATNKDFGGPRLRPVRRVPV